MSAVIKVSRPRPMPSAGSTHDDEQSAELQIVCRLVDTSLSNSIAIDLLLNPNLQFRTMV